MTGTYEIEIVHYREGQSPLRQSISCDAEMAVGYLVTVAHEIASTAGVDLAPLADWEEPRISRTDPRWEQLRIGTHPMALDPRRGPE